MGNSRRRLSELVSEVMRCAIDEELAWRDVQAPLSAPLSADAQREHHYARRVWLSRKAELDIAVERMVAAHQALTVPSEH